MDFSKLHVVVVEDHEFQRRIAVQLLRGLGVKELIEAGDGSEALQQLEHLVQKPDVVFSDLDMPGMDGIEFIRNLAQRHLAHAVAITSHLDASMLHTVETMARAYGLQVLGAIEKPVTARRLTQLLGLYHPGRDPAGGRSLPAEALTRAALEQAFEFGEFVPHYQPKIELRNGKLGGVEALARWMRSGEVLLPDQFLPAIEAAGLLDLLAETMLHHACEQLGRWDTHVPNVAVNVSMLNLADVGIADHYVSLVRKHRVDPKRVIIEVTESSVMNDPARSLDVLARLRLKGFGLAIDDFGTGYSSLQQLGAIPFTELKVDQSFVKGAAEDPRKRTMVETSLDLARRLKLNSVAEGAETRADWDLLIGMGCDQIQGYFVSRPLAAGKFTEWSRSWKAPTS
jgi:EAL domain-containing protein (putative c-di-GMP-specific phosphodiesterase class I)